MLECDSSRARQSPLWTRRTGRARRDGTRDDNGIGSLRPSRSVSASQIWGTVGCLSKGWPYHGPRLTRFWYPSRAAQRSCRYLLQQLSDGRSRSYGPAAPRGGTHEGFKAARKHHGDHLLFYPKIALTDPQSPTLPLHFAQVMLRRYSGHDPGSRQTWFRHVDSAL